MKALCGTWVNFEEIENYFDEYRARIDAFERHTRSAAVRERYAAYRRLLGSVEADLDHMRQRGILVDAVPVYSLGTVDRAESPCGPVGARVDDRDPDVDFGDGDWL